MGKPVFEDAFSDYFAVAFKVAHRIVGNHHDAEDVAAETMMRACDKWHRVARMESPAGWVVRVSSNLAIDTVRRRRLLERQAGDPAGRLDDADSHLDLVTLLCRLPRRQRDVIALRYLVGFSEAEIAALLGIAPGSVKRHASRALDRLRRDRAEEAHSLAC